MTYYPGLFNSTIPVSPWVLKESVNDMKLESDYQKDHNQYVLTHDFKEFLAKVNLSDVEHDVHIKTGKASREIMACIALFNTGLLIMGTMGKTGYFTKLLGGTVEKVLDQLPCSILTIPHK